METNTVNSFLDQFLAVADSGFGLIQGDVNFVLNALIVVSIALAGVQWALAQEALLAPFFRKVLFIGLFAFLINNWSGLVVAINQSGAMLGLKAGGGTLSLPDLSNPGRIANIGVELFGKTASLGEGMNILIEPIPLMTIFLAAILVMLAFFMLALQLFVSLIAFKLGALAAFVALPWGVFRGTAWVAERPLGWVAACAVRLFVLALIASVAIGFVNTLPATFSMDNGGVLNVLLFGLTVAALAWFGPALASEVMSGQPHLSGSDAVTLGMGAGATAMFAGGRAIAATRFAASTALKIGSGAFNLSKTAARAFTRGGSRAPIDHSKLQPRPPRSGAAMGDRT